MTFFIDIDGTVLKYGTMEPMDGAVEEVNRLVSAGHDVVMTTLRREDNDPPSLGLAATRKRLEELGFRFHSVVGGIGSPRVAVNDEGAVGIPLARNAGIDFGRTADRVGDMLRSLAWMGAKDISDADDYVQCVIAARSIVEKGGFDHPHMARSLGEVPAHWRSRGIWTGGCMTPELEEEARRAREGLRAGDDDGKYRYRSSIYHLVASGNPLHVDRHGLLTDGAAMRMMPIAARYRRDPVAMAEKAAQCTAITHSSSDAIMSSVVVAEAMRSAIVGENLTAYDLYSRTMSFASHLRIPGCMTSGSVSRAFSIMLSGGDFGDFIGRMSREVGMGHWSWECPISAAFLSTLVREPNSLGMVMSRLEWHPERTETMSDGSEVTSPRRLAYSGRDLPPLDGERAEERDSYLSGMPPEALAPGKVSVDGDTFLSLFLQICSAKVGWDRPIDPGTFGDDLDAIAAGLAMSSGAVP